MGAQGRTMQDWVAFLTKTELPVLRKSIEQIEFYKSHIDTVTIRDLSQVALDDPMLTLKVMSLLQQYRRPSPISSEVTTFGKVLMMIGIEPFFQYVEGISAIEDLLADDQNALSNALDVIDRSRYASRYAFEFAEYRFDIDRYEVQIATLLHSTAEIALWCFAPSMMRKVRALASRYRHSRSDNLQEHVFGFTFNELQKAMAQAWKLPELLTTLMDKRQDDNPRVKTVVIATDLARHSANGLDDPALPTDYLNVSTLLGQEMEQVLMNIAAIRQSVTSVRNEDNRGFLSPEDTPISFEEIQNFESHYPTTDTASVESEDLATNDKCETGNSTSVI